MIKKFILMLFCVVLIIVLGACQLDSPAPVEESNVEINNLGTEFEKELLTSVGEKDWQSGRLLVFSGSRNYKLKENIDLYIYNPLNEFVHYSSTALGLTVEKKVNGRWKEYDVPIIGLQVIVTQKPGEMMVYTMMGDLITKPGVYRFTVNGSNEERRISGCTGEVNIGRIEELS